MTIQETPLFSAAGVSAAATEYVSDAAAGDGICLYLENNADVEVTVCCRTVAVNNYMTPCLFDCTIAPGETATDILYLDSSEFAAAGIDRIGQIDFYFSMLDSGGRYWGADLAPVTVKTSDYDPLDMVPREDGTELFHADGLKIVLTDVDENHFWGTGVALYLENNASWDLTVVCSQMTINGISVDPYFSCPIHAGRRAVDHITVLESDFTNNGIESVEEITVTFQVFLADDTEPLFETDSIAFSVLK